MNKPRLGVVVVVPFWSQSDNMNADSNYAYLRIVLPEMVKQTEDTIFIVLFPDPKYGSDRWVYTPDGLQSDRIRFYAWNYDTAMATSISGWDVMRFKKLEDEQAPTMYWLHQVESGAFIAGGYKKAYAVANQPCLIAQHHYIIHRSLPYVYDTMFTRQWLQIGGSVASDAVVYNSDHCRNMARESFSDYLNKDALQKLENKSATLKFGLLRGDEPLSEEANDQTKPIFIYNHRFESYKNPKDTFDQFEKLRKKYQFEVWASQTAGQRTAGKKKFDIDKAIFEPSRNDYLKRIAVPAINTINSVHETFCISILDSMAVGNLVVVPNAVTFPELIPNDYPYIFRNLNEQYNMLDHILSNFKEEYNKWRPILSDHARKNFNLTTYVKNYIDLMVEKENARREVEMKDNTEKWFKDVIDNMTPKKLYKPIDLRRIFSSNSGVGAQAMTVARFLRETLRYYDNIHVVWNDGVKLYKD